MKLTLLALTYFQKTAELQHLTHAAEALHISQPSLSHTIKMLASPCFADPEETSSSPSTGKSFSAIQTGL
mgnify:CR=1 FL=1